MKRFTTTTLVILFITIAAVGQTKTYYHKNPFEKTFTKVQRGPTFGTDSLALQNYLTDKLKSQLFQTAGEIKVGMFIDSTGKPLCHWIDNHSNFNMDQHKLNLTLDEMPNWNAGIIANRKVDCAVLITLDFNNHNLFVQYKTGTH